MMDDRLAPQISIDKQFSQKLRLLDGRVVEVSASNFQLRHLDSNKSIRIPFGWFDETKELHRSLFRVITNIFSTHSLDYAHTTSRAFSRWNDFLPLPCQLSLKDLESINEMPPTYANFLIPTLRKISEANLPGMSDDVVNWLASGHNFEEKDDGPYFALMTNDPQRGALTDQELHNIHTALNMARERLQIDQEAYTLAWMFMGTGLRPIQVARMKVSDVLVRKGPEGKEVTLKVSLAKGEKSSKSEYWLRRAPTVLAECLLFYLDICNKSKNNTNEYLFLAHQKDRNLGAYVKQIFTSLETWSDRLETQIPINAYRFRYTLATRALRQGASDYEVARLLTHRSTSCIQYYRASMPELQQPIHTAIGKEMDYFARAFQGKLIRTLQEATYPNDGEQEILDFMHLTGETLGACGTRSECHLNAPVACLSCHRFEPLEDAPWEDLLQKLKDDQKTEKEERIRMINHNAMSSIIEIMAERDNRSTRRT